MLSSLVEFFQANVPDFRDRTYLVATSGGRDSMALLHALHSMNLTISCCHVHFGLRPEADADLELVRSYAVRLDVPCSTIAFDTKEYARMQRISTQEAARELRYQWFFELMERHAFDQLVTAHHQDDEIETWLINALRGSGWRGMMSIPANRNRILRPLLGVSRKEIDHYVTHHSIPYLEDSSNLGDEYLRNRIRHHLIPLLDDLLDGRPNQLPATIRHLKETGDFLQSIFEDLASKTIEKNGVLVVVRAEELRHFNNPAYVLGELLYPYGFSFEQAANLWHSWENKRTGAHVSGAIYEALIDREKMLLRPLTVPFTTSMVITYSELPFYKSLPIGTLEIMASFAPSHLEETVHSIYFKATQIVWPLEFRPWHPGDRIQSFGMGGKTQKVQDVLTDAKRSLWEKEQTYVLGDQEQILWIPGLKMAEKGRHLPGDDCIRMTFRTTVS